jgi:hypothetical protein
MAPLDEYLMDQDAEIALARSQDFSIPRERRGARVRKPVGGSRRMSKEIRQLIFQMVTQNPDRGATSHSRRAPAPLSTQWERWLLQAARSTM